mmetsp:Transcript_27799/g.45982  ORF Transcript_27799/g.45982 Transcript_27799/m.45982 type:complete len:80 (-) Transcript_27799:80-319(-)
MRAFFLSYEDRRRMWNSYSPYYSKQEIKKCPNLYIGVEESIEIGTGYLLLLLLLQFGANIDRERRKISVGTASCDLKWS